MITRKILLVGLLAVCCPAFSQTYITNTTIVDVTTKKLLNNRTIEITNDKISNIQSAKKVKIPANATVIDGTGKFVAPGLVDAHVHFFQNGGLYTRPDVIDLQEFKPYKNEIHSANTSMEDKLRRYLQNGITTLIDVGSTYNFLRQKEQFKDKDFAPAVYMTGPLATTYEPEVYLNLKDDEPFNLVKTVEDGIKSVQNQLPLRPDFIKIWYIAGNDGLDPEASARKNLPIIKATIDEAHKHNLKVAVHATERLTAQLAVENGADFLVHSVEDEIIKPDFVALLKKNKTVLCPTLIVHGSYIHTFHQDLPFTTDEFLNADAFQLGTLTDLKHLSDTTRVNRYKKMASGRITELEKADAITMANLKILSDAGVIIATGTDAGNIGTLHASSYAAELQAMKKSGMDNWQIIIASTLNGAKVLGKENEFGSVTKGKKANLILLDQNPVTDISNLSKINTVINKGIAFTPEKLLQDTPEILVQRQLNGYNYRNIEAFLEPYADDVEVYLYPDKLLGKGKEGMRKSYSEMFDKTPNLHCELKARIVQGNIVIDKEYVRFANEYVDATAIYHIENGKIKKVYFVE